VELQGMAMSRYANDYSLTPARPTGWRPVLTSAVTIATIVAVSAISGAVVTLDLLAPPSRHAETAAASAAVTVAQAPAPTRAARVVTPRLPEEAARAVGANANQDQQPAVAAVPQPAAPAAPAPQPAPVAPVVAADEGISAPASESELTFASGYALRRAVQEAATAPPSASAQVARVEAESQFGRAAVKVKPKTYARTNGAQDRRTADARGDGMFDRFDRNDKFNFERHQALAFGEQRANRRSAPPQQQGGLFGSSPGGLFGGLF
jgi:hypothetical protein